jgi:hypothetical protein
VPIRDGVPLFLVSLASVLRIRSIVFTLATIFYALISLCHRTRQLTLKNKGILSTPTQTGNSKRPF